MNTSDCAAKRNLEELRARKASGAQNNPLLSSSYPQNIGGVIVPPPLGSQQFSIKENSRPQILRKSDLAVPDSSLAPGTTLAQVVELNDQSVGVSATNTSSTKDRATNIRTTKMSQDGVTSHNLQLSQSGILYTLKMIREPVVDYQETRGVPRNEEITFLTLVTSLCTQAYTAAITILVMLWNLMPLVDGLVYFVRFFLDKLIDIVQTDDNKDRAIKSAIFFGELAIITFIIFMIVGLIFMPVYVLMARLFSKIFSMIAW